MNRIFILLFFLVSSCAHQTKTLQVSKTNNAFAGEGFVRWTQVDLQRLNNTNELTQLQAQCHQQKVGNKESLNSLMAMFSTTLSENQDNAEYWNHIATCYLYHQEFAKAQFTIDFALIKKPSSPIKAALMNNKGLISLKLGHHNDAIESFKEAIKLSPRSLTPQFNLALLYLEYGHVQLALPILQRLHTLNLNDEEIMTHLGFALVLTQQHAKAKHLFSQLSEPYKRRADVTVVMAINELELGHPEEARHLMLRQARTQSTHIRKMTQVTERRINHSLELKRVAEESKKKQTRSTASERQEE